jgi:protein-arginine kinase activator protein McsA
MNKDKLHYMTIRKMSSELYKAIRLKTFEEGTTIQDVVLRTLEEKFLKDEKGE